MDNFKAQVKKSFSVCRNDIDVLKFENNDLKEQLKQQNTQIEELKSQLKGLVYAIEILKGSNLNVNNLNKNVNSDLIDTNTNMQSSMQNNIANNIISNPLKREDPYEELLRFKAKVNKKDMLKNKLLAMINEHGTLLTEVKFLFVKQQNYCSNATFYNYLKELELENKLVIRRERNRNYIFLTNAIQENYNKNNNSNFKENYYSSYNG